MTNILHEGDRLSQDLFVSHSISRIRNITFQQHEKFWW